MAKLIISALTSLDGYVADEDGNFDFLQPDEEVHAFVNELQRPVGTYLLGRRMYEVMTYWETPEAVADDQPRAMTDFAEIWRAADKVVYSTTLDKVSAPKTRLEREFYVNAIRRLKSEAKRDIGIAGPNLASAAIRAGLVDEYQFLLAPLVVGGGNHALPAGVRLTLELMEERRFTNGVVFLRYRAGNP